MHNAQLVGGDIANFVPIGLDGVPVYMSAESFIDAIERTPTLGTKYSRHLAKPKFNGDFSHVDWYVPFAPSSQDGEYRIVSWQTASPQEKSAAQKILDEFEEALDRTGQELLGLSLTGDARLFAHFLTGVHATENLPAVHFPGAEYVYIVDGIPVITFWGFLRPGQNTQNSPFAILKEPSASFSAQAPKAAAAAAAGASAIPPQDDEPNKRKFGFGFLKWLLPLLLLLALLALAFFLFRGCSSDLSFPEPTLPELSGPDVPDENISLPDVDLPDVDLPKADLPDVDLPDVNLPDVNVDGSLNANLPDVNLPNVNVDGGNINANLPNVNLPDVNVEREVINTNEPEVNLPNVNLNEEELNANLQVPDETLGQIKEDEIPMLEIVRPNTSEVAEGVNTSNVQEVVTSNEGVVGQATTPPELNQGQVPNLTSNVEPVALQLSNADLQQGNVQVLKGQWQTRSGMMDSTTGRPLNLSYRFDGQKGELVVQRQDGSRCVTQANPKIINGNLEIISQASALCPDQSSYVLPKIKCTNNEQGKTVCHAEYEGQKPFRVRMYEN